MPNNKALFIVLMVMGLFIAALLLHQATLILLAIPFLTYLMMGILRSPGKPDVEAARHLSRVLGDAGELIEMRVSIHNRASSAINIHLQDPLFPSMETVEGSASRYVYAAPGESGELAYAFRVGRGVYGWKTIHVIATDPFCLFEQAQDLPAALELLIRPAPVRLRRLPLRPFITRHIPGSMPARLAGSGTSFFGIRDYQPGDPLRKLHWRMTARHPGELFTKEFEQDEIADIGVILDARALEGDQEGENSFFEQTVGAAASLADLFLREGNRLGLLVFGDRMIAHYPGNGKKHLHRIERTLAQVRPSRYISMEYLSYFSYRLFPRQSMIFMVSPLGPRDLPAYSRMAAEGYQVILLSPNPIDHTARAMPSDPVHTLAFRAAKMDRHVQLNRLLDLGIQVIDWPTDRPLNSALQQALIPLSMGHQRRLRR